MRNTKEVRIKTYKNEREYAHDAPRMAKGGWLQEGDPTVHDRVEWSKELKLPERAGSPLPQRRAPDVRVKTYGSDGEFQKDANKMVADGYSIRGQIGRPGHVSLGKTLIKSNLTLGLGLLTGFSRTKDKITVTWGR